MFIILSIVSIYDLAWTSFISFHTWSCLPSTEWVKHSCNFETGKSENPAIIVILWIYLLEGAEMIYATPSLEKKQCIFHILLQLYNGLKFSELKEGKIFLHFNISDGH